MFEDNFDLGIHLGQIIQERNSLSSVVRNKQDKNMLKMKRKWVINAGSDSGGLQISEQLIAVRGSDDILMVNRFSAWGLGWQFKPSFTCA